MDIERCLPTPHVLGMCPCHPASTGFVWSHNGDLAGAYVFDDMLMGSMPLSIFEIPVANLRYNTALLGDRFPMFLVRCLSLIIRTMSVRISTALDVLLRHLLGVCIRRPVVSGKVTGSLHACKCSVEHISTIRTRGSTTARSRR